MATNPNGFRVDGISKVMNNLAKAIQNIEGATTVGLLEAGLVVQRDAMQRVPVEYGFLRASAYTQKSNIVVFGQSGAIQPVEVGFHASYALYVHENMEMKLAGEPRPSGLGVYWGPHGQPKFLENALKANYENILNIIKKRAKPSGNII